MTNICYVGELPVLTFISSMPYVRQTSKPPNSASMSLPSPFIRSFAKGRTLPKLLLPNPPPPLPYTFLLPPSTCTNNNTSILQHPTPPHPSAPAYPPPNQPLTLSTKKSHPIDSPTAPPISPKEHTSTSTFPFQNTPSRMPTSPPKSANRDFVSKESKGNFPF